FSTSKTGGGLHAIKFSSRHPNHPVAPESITEKVRLRLADEILLFAVIRRLWLNHKTLGKIVSTRTKAAAIAIEIDLVRHVIECPHAVALAAIKGRIGTFQTFRIGYCRLGLGGEMKFETPDRVAIGFDVLVSFIVTSFAGNSELSDLGIPPVTLDKT